MANWNVLGYVLFHWNILDTLETQWCLYDTKPASYHVLAYHSSYDPESMKRIWTGHVHATVSFCISYNLLPVLLQAYTMLSIYYATISTIRIFSFFKNEIWFHVHACIPAIIVEFFIPIASLHNRFQEIISFSLPQIFCRPLFNSSIFNLVFLKGTRALEQTLRKKGGFLISADYNFHFCWKMITYIGYVYNVWN